MKDLFGKALLDYQTGNYSEDIVTSTNISDEDVLPLPYLFREFKDMPKLEQKALELCKGSILDVGCGAGSHSLYLQENNFEVKAIDISKGASFGFGDHPTTRLAIQGIEAALSENHGILKADNSRALDIGTGSGVLAIAAVLLGIKRAVGIDIDPCARDEAQKNIKLNGLEHRIKILDTSVEDIKETYSLITANLRYPTLKRLCSHIAKITQKKGAVVVSGIKSDEVEDLLDNFTQNGFQCTWKAFEKDWAGMVLSR